MNSGKPTSNDVAPQFQPHNRLTALFADSGPQDRQSADHAHTAQSPSAPAHPVTTNPKPIITEAHARAVESLDADTLNDLLTSFLFDGESLRDLAARLDLSLNELIAWHDHPRTQEMMDHLDRIAAARAQRQRTQAAPAAVHALGLITQIHSANKPETARKAATTLLKNPVPRRAPSAPSVEPQPPAPRREKNNGPKAARRVTTSLNPESSDHLLASPVLTGSSGPAGVNMRPGSVIVLGGGSCGTAKP